MLADEFQGMVEIKEPLTAKQIKNNRPNEEESLDDLIEVAGFYLRLAANIATANNLRLQDIMRKELERIDETNETKD